MNQSVRSWGRSCGGYGRGSERGRGGGFSVAASGTWLTYLRKHVAREARKEVVAQRMREFGQAGHAGDYKPIPLAEVATQYEHEFAAVR
jgi:hypothetical protein